MMEIQSFRRFKQNSKVAAKIRVFESLIESNHSNPRKELKSNRYPIVTGTAEIRKNRGGSKGSNLSLSGSTTSGYASTSSPEPEVEISLLRSRRKDLTVTSPEIDDVISDPEDKAIEEAIFANCTTDEEDLRWSDLETPTEDDIDIDNQIDISKESILNAVDYHKYRSELQVFCRDGGIVSARRERDAHSKLVNTIIKIQALCRGYITRNQWARTQQTTLMNSPFRVAALGEERPDFVTNVGDCAQTEVIYPADDIIRPYSTSTLFSERLEYETVSPVDQRELYDGRNTLGSTSEESDEKGERISNELEWTRRLLVRQQRDDDMENLNAVKKQMEKKLSDAYQEIAEERQYVSQWKRKAQKAANELDDFKLLHEEQATIKTVLEKRIKTLESELQLLNGQIRQLRLENERLVNEHQDAITDKRTLEQTIQSLQLELDSRIQKASVPSSVRNIPAERSGQAVEPSTREKAELVLKIKEQEEELDDLVSQVAMLEASRQRLEAVIEQMKKNNEDEIQQKDEEIDDVKRSFQKKIQVLETQLDSENDERTLLLRAKRELERQLSEANERLSHPAETEVIRKLKKDLKLAKALLKDATSQLDSEKFTTTDKVLLRQLRNRLEDAEFARTVAHRAKQHAEHELAGVQQQLEYALRVKADAEEKYLNANRERNKIQGQLDDTETELDELIRKYKTAMEQLAIEQKALQEQNSLLSVLEQERDALKDQVVELSARLEVTETDPQLVHAQKSLQLKVRELEGRLELEQTMKTRITAQLTRLRENFEKIQFENDSRRSKEHLYIETIKRLQRQLRDLREEQHDTQEKDQTDHKSTYAKDLEEKLELVLSENEDLRKNLSRALKRITDLQAVIHDDLDSVCDEMHYIDNDSDDEEYYSSGQSSPVCSHYSLRTPTSTALELPESFA